MDKADQKNLKIRILSAAIIIPFVSAAIYMGGVFYAALICLFAFAALYEWNMLAFETKNRNVLVVVGFLYISVCGVLLWYMRAFGWEFVLVFFVSIWASDTGGYLFGKFLKGPKLLPSVSPNKTWSGLIGACVGPLLISTIVYGFLDGGLQWFPSGGWIVFYAAVVGISGQVGDLLISKFKRMAQAKDAGTIIPGHGGVLDRIDSLLMATFFISVYLFYFLANYFAS